ncbi:Hypothetical protein FSTVST1_109 [Faustovirus ST1]|nr:Hypothetical protein FSTVST1_109 [Faustovirus ST1]
MAYSFVNTVFNSAIGDFNVEIKYHAGTSVYKGTYAANHGHIDCGGKMEYNPENMTVYIGNSMTTTELRTTPGPGNHALKMYVVDGVHPDYTIILKITDGPDVPINLKKLLQDNVHKLVKQVPINDTIVDFPLKSNDLHWHLTSYNNTSHLAINGVIEARVTKGQMDFISKCPKACYLVYVNPDNNYTIVAYSNSLASYVESGKKEKLQEIYDKIMGRLNTRGVNIQHGFVNPNKEIFNPYPVANAANNVAPNVAPNAIATPDSKFVKLARDGDFMVIESSAKISQLEFCFETGVQQLTVINNFSLVPNDLIKTTTEDTRKMTVTVDIDATQARLLFMTLGQTLINQLSHVKLGVK